MGAGYAHLRLLYVGGLVWSANKGQQLGPCIVIFLYKNG